MAAASVSAETAAAGVPRRGIGFDRFFTAGLPAGISPYEAVTWETRKASIGNEKGEILFEQEVEVPNGWSQTATNIVANKYFHGKLGTSERESSVKQFVHRVVDTIAGWGKTNGYFQTSEDSEVFRDELAHLILTQKASFNSPVWFNVGVNEARGYGWCYDAAAGSIRRLQDAESRPQCSACFINSVADSMESILDLAKTEGMLFKYGSGTGSNLST
jgi:ribonucleoside-diphosphate reductase alpha chain